MVLDLVVISWHITKGIGNETRKRQVRLHEKFKVCLSSKDSIHRVKVLRIEWERVFGNHTSGGKVKVLVTQSCPALFDPMDYIACQAPLSMEFSRQEY